MDKSKCKNCVFKNAFEPKRYCYMYTLAPKTSCDMFKHSQDVQIEEINIDDFSIDDLVLVS